VNEGAFLGSKANCFIFANGSD